MSAAATSKVPPDGGYGWVVTFAYALNNVVVLPLITGFGLIFQEALHETELSALQGSLVLTLNHSIGMLLSFFGGPLLRRFGYRKVAAVGALFVSAGLMITSTASSFLVFVLSYSIINSMGVAAVMSAFTLAINSFFKEKRSRAIAVGMSMTGLGTIIMPTVMSSLMYTYGWRYAILILGAICLHSLLAACLLRPAKWYLKEPATSEETVPLNKEKEVQLINGSLTTSSKPEIASITRVEEPVGNGTLPLKSTSMRSLNGSSNLQTRNAISHPDIRSQQPESLLSESRYKWWESQEVNLGSSINIFNEAEITKKPKEMEVETNKKEKKGYLDSFVEFFDLTLLKDPIFVNILFGLSIAACVETNFSLLLPIILNDMLQFETSSIANLMTIINISDTISRLMAPFIGEWCSKPPRVMYMISLMLAIFVRSLMLFATTFTSMIFVALALGFAKGVRTVYMNVVMPSYVPIDRLAYASGIQMLFNGLTIITIGSILGKVRQVSGSYQLPIIILNVVTFLTILLWSCEFLYFRIKNKNQPKAQTDA